MIHILYDKLMNEDPKGRKSWTLQKNSCLLDLFNEVDTT